MKVLLNVQYQDKEKVKKFRNLLGGRMTLVPRYSVATALCEPSAHFVRSVGSDRASSVTKKADQMVCLFRGWGGRIRTCACMDQNHVPYHLATPHYE